MTGVCPLCKELIVSDVVCNPDVRNVETVQAAMCLLTAVRDHWALRHTPPANSRQLPPWIHAHIASTYGQLIAYANACQVSAIDRRGFVYGLFYMRQQLLSVGFDPLNQKLAARPVHLESPADALSDPLVIQGRMEAYEGLLRDGAVTSAMIAEKLSYEMNCYGAATAGVVAPVGVRCGSDAGAVVP